MNEFTHPFIKSTLTDRLLHQRKSSPFPKCEQQKDLAQSLHIFFTDKIKCIQDQFERVNDLHPRTRALSSSKFVGFHEVSKDEMQKILSYSPGITYNLGPIPSALLKKCSDAVFKCFLTWEKICLLSKLRKSDLC